jgi:hypothetical protein
MIMAGDQLSHPRSCLSDRFGLNVVTKPLARCVTNLSSRSTTISLTISLTEANNIDRHKQRRELMVQLAVKHLSASVSKCQQASATSTDRT